MFGEKPISLITQNYDFIIIYVNEAINIISVLEGAGTCNKPTDKGPWATGRQRRLQEKKGLGMR